jgi:hypothetical protein
MKPFYYFCNNVEERFDARTLDNVSAGLNELPNNWIHHNSEAVTGKTLDEHSEEEQSKLNGVLDYTQWMAPPYKSYYKGLNVVERPYIVINNNYNIEFGNSIEKSIRYFDVPTLNVMFNYLTDKGYDIIYKRPNNTEFAIDQNEMATLDQGFTLCAHTTDGVISDYEVCDYYDNVHNLNTLKDNYDYSYNEFQLRVFADASGFITPNGGGGILCGYFGSSVVMYVPHGKELRTNYLTNKNSYYNKLSDNKLYPVLDFNNESNYIKVVDKIKEVFNGAE